MEDKKLVSLTYGDYYLRMPTTTVAAKALHAVIDGICKAEEQTSFVEVDRSAELVEPITKNTKYSSELLAATKKTAKRKYRKRAEKRLPKVKISDNTILEFMDDGETYTAEDLQKQFKLSKGNAWFKLNSLVKEGKLTRSGRGRYKIPEESDEPKEPIEDPLVEESEQETALAMDEQPSARQIVDKFVEQNEGKDFSQEEFNDYCLEKGIEDHKITEFLDKLESDKRVIRKEDGTYSVPLSTSSDEIVTSKTYAYKVRDCKTCGLPQNLPGMHDECNKNFIVIDKKDKEFFQYIDDHKGEEVSVSELASLFGFTDLAVAARLRKVYWKVVRIGNGRIRILAQPTSPYPTPFGAHAR